MRPFSEAAFINKAKCHMSINGEHSNAQVLQARIAELEAAVVEYELQQQIAEAKDRLRDAILDMAREDDWKRAVVSCHSELSRFIGFEFLSINFFNLQSPRFASYEANSDGEVTTSESLLLPDSLKRLLEIGAPVYRRTQSEVASGDVEQPHAKGSILDVPFGAGSLAISCERENAFSQRDIDIVVAFAPVVHEAFYRLRDMQHRQEQEQLLRQSQKMEAVGQLTTGIAHNFNNMLQVILGNLSMSKIEPNFASRQLMLDHAESAAQRAAEIVRQLMVVVRPQSSRALEAINTERCIRHIVNLAQRTFDRRINVTLDIAGDLPNLEIDNDHFEQILLNILLNARDAVTAVTDRSPQISIKARESPEHLPDDPHAYISIVIADNGIGMDHDTRVQIFEPFFTTKSIDEATGLGLPMVESIIRQQGGTITFTTEMDQGSTFSVFLPIKHDLADVTAPVKKTILIVEDEEPVRISIMDMLQLAGYRAVSASNGREGLDVYRRTIPDLVMLDLSMPEMSGHELFREIRHIDPDAKILICTGLATDPEEFGEEAVILDKPFLVTELYDAIKRLIPPTNSTEN